MMENFKIIKPNIKQNITKITPRKILAIWLLLTVLLTILVPRVFDLKDYKPDHILFAMLFISFIIIIGLIVLLIKLINDKSIK
jgi:hypothetical protein